MLWRLWQQHRADRAEARAIRVYLERHVAAVTAGAPRERR